MRLAGRLSAKRITDSFTDPNLLRDPFGRPRSDRECYIRTAAMEPFNGRRYDVKGKPPNRCDSYLTPREVADFLRSRGQGIEPNEAPLYFLEEHEGLFRW